jgi:3-oxoacyl-(acyl-carrier-protein) synthase
LSFDSTKDILIKWIIYIYLQVNYINCHATSTLAGDLAEVNAIKQVFKDPSGIKINATKVLHPPVSFTSD